MKKILQKILGFFELRLIKSKFERQAIVEAKKHFKNKGIVACEIGVFEGEHALQMLKHLNIRKLYLIDPYEKYEDYKKDGSYSKVLKARMKAHKRLEKYKDKIILIEKYSDDAVKDIKEKLDFIYIDGNHFSPYVDNDIKNYYSLVKEGGIISGHDYSQTFMDVVIAVNKFYIKENKRFLFGDWSDWIIFK